MLSESTFLQYAMRHYSNPSCSSLEDFQHDLDRIKHLKKLLNKVYHEKPVKVQLILNHLTILYNVFDQHACTAMLFFKIEKQYWDMLKTLLDYLNLMPEFLPELGIITKNIHDNEVIKQELKEL